ncbi:MAG: ABC transporter ATP-binding protein [Peptostreptococcaceae bacterium]|nr:ABC transporter ATP-binding protein [Peptostreptococcaceae bacterium]
MTEQRKKIEIEDIEKEVCNEGRRKKILSGVKLSIEQGEIFCIMGPSGSGKSSLLKILGGMDRASGGEIDFFGKKMSNFQEEDYERHRRDTVGYIFQEYNLLEGLTVRENLVLPLILQNHPPEKIWEKYREILRRIEIGDLEEEYPERLSGGEQQRVAVCRALIKSPEVVLADEPTGSLDRENREVFLQMICEINRQLGMTMIIVTHDACVASHGNRVAWMEDGKVKKFFEKTGDARSFHRELVNFSAEVRDVKNGSFPA